MNGKKAVKSEKSGTKGYSMLPTIWPGCELKMHDFDGSLVNPGDVVCYLGSGGRIVAHRVVGVEAVKEDECVLRLRGDAQSEVERVPESAIAYRVCEVRYGPVGYRCEGLFGRAISRVVLRYPWAILMLARAVRKADVTTARALRKIGIGKSAQ
jgi:hypothetical protein